MTEPRAVLLSGRALEIVQLVALSDRGTDLDAAARALIICGTAALLVLNDRKKEPTTA